MDLGMSELLVIGIVALIVIGPKDLPEMFRQLGRFTAKMRSMAREFNRAMEQAANETGVKDVARDLRNVTNPKAMGLEAVKGAVDKFEKWDPIKNAARPSDPSAVGAKPLVPPPMPPVAQPKPTEAAPAATAAAEAAPASADPAPAAPSVGPSTAALYEKQAARKAILQESADKLRALDASPVAAAEPAPKPARAPRKAKAAAPEATAPETQAEASPKPAKPAARATRKKKAVEE